MKTIEQGMKEEETKANVRLQCEVDNSAAVGNAFRNRWLVCP